MLTGSERATLRRLVMEETQRLRYDDKLHSDSNPLWPRRLARLNVILTKLRTNDATNREDASDGIDTSG